MGDRAEQERARPIRVRAVVTGRVQGVGFRYSALREAERLGVVGTIANHPDGAVVCEVEGAPESVHLTLEWLSHGPRGARVTDVRTERRPAQGQTSFRVTG